MLHHRLRTCGRDRPWMNTFSFDRGFGHKESVCEVCTQTANNEAEETPSENCTGHVGHRKQQFQWYEHRDHRWWVMVYGYEQKQCCSHHIAEEKREARQVHSKRSCWPFLSTILRRYIIRTNHNVKILQKSATWSCLDAPGTLCCANDQNRGWHNLGSSIMTMHPSVVQIWMRLSPPNATSMQYVRPPNPLCDFWSFPYMKMPLKEPNLRRHCVKRSSPAHWDYERYLPEVCAITGETTWKGLQVVYLLFNECISANQGLDTSWMHLIK